MREKLHRLFHSPAAGDLRRWSRPCRRSIVWICILKSLLSALSLLIPLSTRGLIDGAASHDAARLGRSAAVLLLAAMGIRGLSLAVHRLSIRANAALQGSLRAEILSELMKKQYAGLSGFHSGEMVSRMLSDVQVVKNGILEILPDVAGMAVGFAGAVLLLIRMDWRFAGVLIAGGLLGLALIAALETPMKKRHTMVSEAEASYHALLQEVLENLLLVKASGSGQRLAQKIRQRENRLETAQIQKGDFSAAMNHWINLAFQLSWLLCLVWGGIGIYRGSLSYGMLAAMLQLANQVQGPISSAAGIAGRVYAMISSAERIRELTVLPEEPEQQPPGSGETTLEEIRLENVQFGYDKESGPVLRRLNRIIHAGDFVAVTGLSGEGKTTLFRLLLGVYQPDGGSVSLLLHSPGEKQPRSVPIGVWTRKFFAYVPQGNTLFSGTLRENIAMFTESADDETILAAAQTACLKEWVSSLPDGLDTMLGERGLGVSEGQAQRIAIARAILTQAPVLLLDECTSALDEQTEAQLLSNLSRLKGRTCLMITHRKAVLAVCDYSLRVEHGTVTQSDPAEACHAVE